MIKDPALNAFAMPNNTIYIHTGILAAAENEAEAAALIGHEMTHILNRHMLKRFRDLINKSALMSTISFPMALAGGSLGSMLTQLAVISTIYGFSQEQEFEADSGGFSMLKTAGYDLKESPKLFEHLKVFVKDEELKEPFFFSSHPKIVERIENFQELISRNGESTGSKINEEILRTKSDNCGRIIFCCA